jgi:hypothetical protein
VFLVLRQEGIALQGQLGITCGFEQPSADVEFIGAQIQNCVVQLTGHL